MMELQEIITLAAFSWLITGIIVIGFSKKVRDWVFVYNLHHLWRGFCLMGPCHTIMGAVVFICSRFDSTLIKKAERSHATK